MLIVSEYFIWLNGLLIFFTGVKSKVFEFDLKLFVQKIGIAISIRLAPAFANIFMAMIIGLINAIDEFKSFSWHLIKSFANSLTNN